MVTRVGDTHATHCPTGRPSSHPQRQRAAGGLDALCAEIGLAGKSGRVQSLCGLTRHRGNIASSKQGSFSLPALWQGAREQGVGGMLETASHMRLTGQIKPMVCDTQQLSFFLVILSRVCLWFSGRKHINPVLSCTRLLK